MAVADFLIGGALAVGLGLDRTAAFQFMVSRPIVAAPLTGWLIGDAMAGLQIGAMIELLWLGRLPVGAAVPPDDTQVAIGATILAVSLHGSPWLLGTAFHHSLHPCRHASGQGRPVSGSGRPPLERADCATG